MYEALKFYCVNLAILCPLDCLELAMVWNGDWCFVQVQVHVPHATLVTTVPSSGALHFVFPCKVISGNVSKVVLSIKGTLN